MDKKLFQKYINNECSEEEFESFKLYLEDENSNTKELKKWAKEIWDSGAEDLPVDSKVKDSILDKIHHQININNNAIKPKKWYSQLYRVAAVILLPILIYHFASVYHYKSLLSESINHVDTIRVSTPVGSLSNVVLEDGTIVHLNNKSSLKYPSRFIGDKRVVELSGEAYFEVAHNPEKPFIVKFKNLNVKAVGTEFNVLAYPDDDFIQTTLVKGKVILERKDGNIVSPVGNMIPNQQVLFEKNSGKITSGMVDVNSFTTWRDGNIVFNDESITAIAKRLERMYNVQIRFSDEKAKQFTYRANLTNPTLNEILDLIEMATPVSYNLVNNNNQQNSSKQLITISSKK